MACSAAQRCSRWRWAWACIIGVGASAGALLPKAGPWMDAVKRFFGVLLIAVAIYLVSPVIPLAAQMLAWAALLIVSAVYLRVIDPLSQTGARRSALRQRCWRYRFAGWRGLHGRRAVGRERYIPATVWIDCRTIGDTCFQ